MIRYRHEARHEEDPMFPRRNRPIQPFTRLGLPEYQHPDAFARAEMTSMKSREQNQPKATGQPSIEAITKAVESKLLFSEEKGADLPFQFAQQDTNPATQGGWFDPHTALTQRLGSNYWAPQGIRRMRIDQQRNNNEHKEPGFFE